MGLLMQEPKKNLKPCPGLVDHYKAAYQVTSLP